MVHDLFVSYAHNDDQAPADANYGWVTYFIEELKKVLTQRLGKNPDVWMDHLLLDNYQVEPALNDKIRDSRTIVLFMSPSYLKSPWCQKEIGNFLNRNSAVKNKESVFIVAVEETERTLWHPRLRTLTPLQLYRKSLTGAVHRLGFPRPPVNSEHEYWIQLNELAHLIKTHLEFLETNSPTPPEQTRQEPEQTRVVTAETTTKPIVWIAQPTADLHEQWEGLAATIRQRGATVLPLGVDIYPRTEVEPFVKAANRDISKASLLIQLLSADTGDVAKLLQLQALLAKTQQTSIDIAFLQWRSGNIDLSMVNDAKHRELLQGTMACGFEQFRQLVLEHLDRLLNPKPVSPATNQETQSLSLCITAGPKDAALADEIAQIISDLKHAPLPISPKPEKDQTVEQYNDELRSLLADVDGVILAHSQESKMWLQGQHAKVRKALVNRANPWGAFVDGPPAKRQWDAFVDGSPAERQFIPCSDPGLMYLDCRNGLSAEPIRQFIEKLLGAQHV